MAPVGQTRTHSPHQVQPAWSGSPSPPTMISAWDAPLGDVEHARLPGCPRRRARSGCRGCRGSCRAGSSRRRGARRRARSGSSWRGRHRARRTGRRTARTRCGDWRARRWPRCSPRVALEQELQHAAPVGHGGRGFGFDDHPVGGGRGAGRRPASPGPWTETRQIRQLPTMGSFGYQQSVGMSIPAVAGGVEDRRARARREPGCRQRSAWAWRRSQVVHLPEFRDKPERWQGKRKRAPFRQHGCPGIRAGLRRPLRRRW